MKARTDIRFFLALGTVLLAGYALYSSIDWPLRTALFPRVIGIPLLLLALVEMILSMLGVEKKREGHAVDFELTTDVDPLIAWNRTLGILGWTLGFLFLIVVIGFPIAVPLFVFLYLKLVGKEGWVLTLILTVISWLFMEGLFNRLLHLPFPEGLIFSLLG